MFIGTCLGASDPNRPLQIFYAAIKVPFLLFGAGMMTLPFLGIMLAVGGRFDRFPETVRGVMIAEIGFSGCIASLSPIVLLQAWSGATYATTRSLWILAFLIGLVFAFTQIRRLFSKSSLDVPGIRNVLLAWAVVHALAAVQLAWTLRPFLGRPGSAVEFIRSGPLQNAYLEIWDLVVGQLPW